MRCSLRQQRSAFTLVEMMVAMTLTIFIMTILSQAFIQGLETFSSLKAIGDMQANLRSANQIIRDDLDQDHFTGKRRKSDPAGINPPEDGFVDFGGTSIIEAQDTDTIPSHVSTNQYLHFTVKKRGNKRESFFSAAAGTGTVSKPGLLHPTIEKYFGLPGDGSLYEPGSGLFRSQWAEVAYYLDKTGTIEEPMNVAAPSGTGLYALYRRELLIVTDNTAVNNATVDAALLTSEYPSICCMPNPTNLSVLLFPNPAQLANSPSLRSARTRSYPIGSTLLLPNVLSFTVQVVTDTSSDFVDPGASQVYKAVRITIRIWDVRSQQTRQTTIIQEL